MTDHKHVAAYLDCYACGATDAILVDLDFYLYYITKTIIKPCECGKDDTMVLQYSGTMETVEGTAPPPDWMKEKEYLDE